MNTEENNRKKVIIIAFIDINSESILQNKNSIYQLPIN